MVDVLSFVDEPYLREGRTYNSRTITINGSRLEDLVEPDEDAPAPLVDDYHTSLPFLQALLGGDGVDALRKGRIALGYCSACLDSSCGVLLAGTLSIDIHTAAWTDIGFETEHFGTFGKRKKVIPPEEWWTPDPISPPLGFTFDRAAYVATIEAEIARNSTHP